MGNASDTPWALSVLRAGVSNLLFYSALCGSVYWLSRQDWSIDDAVCTGNSGQAYRINEVFDLSWSADGESFVSRSLGASDGGCSLRLHRFTGDAAAPLSSAPLGMGKECTWTAVLLPDASAVLVVSESQRISRIEISSGEMTELRDLSGADWLSAVAVAGDGAVFAYSHDAEVLLCDLSTGRELLRLTGRPSPVWHLLFSEDNRLIAAGYRDETFRVWERSTGRIINDLGDHDGLVAAFRFVDGGKQLASAGNIEDGTLRLWDVASGELLWKASADQQGVRALAVSNNGRLAATGGNDQSIVLWDLRDRSRLARLTRHGGIVHSLQFSPNGAFLTSASREICLWDVSTSVLLHSMDVRDSSAATGVKN